MMEAVIREYRPNDRPAVIRLLAELQGHIAAIDPYALNRSGPDFDAEAYVDDLLQKNASHDGLLLVAEMDGEVVGCISGRNLKEDDPISHVPVHEGVIDELITRADMRGKRIGQRLLEAVEDAFRKRGYAFVRLICFSPNVDAYRFYQRQGFADRHTCLMKQL